MRTSIQCRVAACLCLLWIAGAAQAQEKIAWAKSLEAALAQARETKKMVMADFFTVW